jgi:hypothetical protein
VFFCSVQCTLFSGSLINTAFTLSGKISPDLIPAEIVVTDNKKGNLCEDKRLCALSDYVNEIFEFPIVLNKACSVAQVLQRKTDNTEYRSPRGAVCRITDLYKDFTYHRLHRGESLVRAVFLGKNRVFHIRQIILRMVIYHHIIDLSSNSVL